MINQLLTPQKFAVLNSLILLIAVSGFTTSSAQVTGLSGWDIYLDAGHSQKENQGLYNYSEAEKVLRVALHLQEMLYEQTDIDTVYMSRTNDSQDVGLSQRTNHANTVNADFYYSIHSDAGAPHVNSTLMLHGGWRQNGQTVEKSPTGGKHMGDIMDRDLTADMRIGRRGNYADRTFYQGFPDNHGNQWPYLHVNRVTVMASVLSEAGFHTNPTQQQRNLNSEWRKLEAQSAFWSILEFHEIDRPEVGIVAGHISNLENGEKINGATITINGQSYTTDTYESLFNNYSNDPDQLSNGFFYIEDLPHGDSLQVVVTADDFYADTTSILLKDDNLTFHDPRLISSRAPYIASTQPANLTMVEPGTDLEITFSRKMNRESVEAALSLSPAHDFEVSWADDTRLKIGTIDLEFETEYELTIAASAKDQYDHELDGNNDGSSGSDYVLEFGTGELDTDPPVMVSTYPHSKRMANEIRPIISVTFDEVVDGDALPDNVIRLVAPDGSDVDGVLKIYDVNSRSVLQFFPEEDLERSETFTIVVAAGIRDRHGNETENTEEVTFQTTGAEKTETKVIDNFNSGVSSWWVPQQSGSTTGIVTEETGRSADSEIVNVLTGSESSLKISYGWANSGPFLIREYLAPGSTPHGVRFDKDYFMQAYVFGDGSGNRFRFVVRDSNNELEASAYYTVDWIGWRLVSWDMANDDVIGWVNGNGVLNGSLFVDSFQLTHSSGSPKTGFINFDDFQVIKYNNYEIPTGIDEELITEVPEEYILEQNYPNPFNPATNITFSLPEQGDVRLEVFNLLGQSVAVLENGRLNAGSHSVSFDARSLSSGVYVYRLTAGGQVFTKKMLLVK